MSKIDISYKSVVRKNRARWAINHTAYQSIGGFWCAIHRRSAKAGVWDTYKRDGKTIRFGTEKEARDYVEQKRIEAMR